MKGKALPLTFTFCLLLLSSLPLSSLSPPSPSSLDSVEAITQQYTSAIAAYSTGDRHTAAALLSPVCCTLRKIEREKERKREKERERKTERGRKNERKGTKEIHIYLLFLFSSLLFTSAASSGWPVHSQCPCCPWGHLCGNARERESSRHLLVLLSSPLSCCVCLHIFSLTHSLSPVMHSVFIPMICPSTWRSASPLIPSPSPSSLSLSLIFSFFRYAAYLFSRFQAFFIQVQDVLGRNLFLSFSLHFFCASDIQSQIPFLSSMSTLSLSLLLLHSSSSLSF